MNSLLSINPVDGRYHSKTENLSQYFSEYALIKYRVWVEIEYFIALLKLDLPALKEFPEDKVQSLRSIAEDFSLEQGQKIKDIERITNHDVKAVEYFLKEVFDEMGLSDFKEFIHFGLTSQDINNTAIPLSLSHYLIDDLFARLDRFSLGLDAFISDEQQTPMLARTHGQPASPTTIGKEIAVFKERLDKQINALRKIKIEAKLGGATGNFNAHKVAYPDIDWRAFADDFIADSLDLSRQQQTTQIEHYDQLAALFQAMSRINTVLLDFSKDMWTYISMDYFKQKVVANEVGSSAMPHKVNPIDFENAEGNLGLANALFTHLANKLPVSRLQRDLTDSTVSRNIGVPFAYTQIALLSLEKGWGKVLVNRQKMDADLEANWMVVAEAIQTILRRENYPNPYEKLKSLTRTNDLINRETMHNFINELGVSEVVKAELKAITPQNYIGYAAK